jgi:hypothetical protein
MSRPHVALVGMCGGLRVRTVPAGQVVRCDRTGDTVAVTDRQSAIHRGVLYCTVATWDKLAAATTSLRPEPSR